MRQAAFVAAIFFTACAPVCAGPTASPSASPSSSPTSTPTATPSPTLAASPTASPRPGYTSRAFGYRIDLPAPWRRSACLSADSPRELPAGETFVQVSEQDEIGTDTGFPFDQVRVMVDANPQRLTPAQWLGAGKMGFSLNQQSEPATLDGRPALLVRSSALFALVYIVPVEDRMWAVGYPYVGSGTSNVPTMEAMVRSFHLLDEQERAAAPATPTPPPARSAETVADALADGFAARDPDRLSGVMAPCMSAFLENAGGTGMPRAAFAAQLRSAFAQGLQVTVTRRPIETDGNSLFVRATWVQGSRTDRRDLFLRKDGEAWTWYLTLTRRPVN